MLRFPIVPGGSGQARPAGRFMFYSVLCSKSIEWGNSTHPAEALLVHEEAALLHVCDLRDPVDRNPQKGLHPVADEGAGVHPCRQLVLHDEVKLGRRNLLQVLRIREKFPGGVKRDRKLPGRVQAKEVAPRCTLPLAGSELNIVFIRTTGRNKAAPVICRELVCHKAGLHMAEREGFEPSRPVSQPTRLAGERLQPLGHLSTRGPYSISQEGVVAILIAGNHRPAAAIARGRFDAQRRARIRTGRCLITPAPAFLRRFSVSGDARPLKTSAASRRGT